MFRFNGWLYYLKKTIYGQFSHLGLAGDHFIKKKLSIDDFLIYA